MRRFGCKVMRAGARLALCIGLATSVVWTGGEASAQMNPCPYTNDGDCDEPNGLGYCAWGTDVADCSNPNSNFGGGSGYAGGGSNTSTGGLMNPCPYTNDGDCDEPNGLGYCAWGTDVADCSNPNSNFGSGSGYAGTSSGGGSSGFTPGAGTGLLDPCPYTNDQVCDEPNGTGRCAWGTDRPDCDGGGIINSTSGPPCGGQIINLDSDPGTLQNYADYRGQCLSIPTQGLNHYAASVWGGADGVYSLNSTLGMAAVHGGVLAVGQAGRVIVQIVARQRPFAGSLSNGVQSGSLQNAPLYGGAGFRFMN